MPRSSRRPGWIFYVVACLVISVLGAFPAASAAAGARRSQELGRSRQVGVAASGEIHGQAGSGAQATSTPVVVHVSKYQPPPQQYPGDVLPGQSPGNGAPQPEVVKAGAADRNGDGGRAFATGGAAGRSACGTTSASPVVVPANGTIVCSAPLQNGVLYTLRITGVFVYGSCPTSTCPSIGADGSEWEDALYGSTSEFNQVQRFWPFGINNYQYEWLDINFHSNHMYEIQLMGDGDPAQFEISDCSGCYDDNAGALTVEIFQGTSPPPATIVTGNNNASPVHFQQRSIASPNSSWPASTWGGSRYGNPNLTSSSDTISHWGDTLTSWAMVVDFWWTQSYSHIDPLDLDTWLITPWNQYYTGFNGPLNVNAAEVQSYANSRSWTRLDLGEAVFSAAQLDQLLNNNIPVILNVTLNGHPHSVVAVGSTKQSNGQETWYVYDPWSGDTFTSPPTLASYGNTASWMQWLAPAVNPNDLTTITAYAGSGADLVITDPQGRRLGHDPRSDTSYNEIPNGTRLVMQESDPSGQLPAPAALDTLLIQRPLPGQYGTQVIGSATGSYQFGYFLTNAEDVGWAQQTLTPQISAGQVVSYPFRYLDVRLSQTYVTQGSTITLTGSGFIPGETVNIYLLGNPNTLEATITTDSSGAFGTAGSPAVTVTVPAFPAGYYTFMSSGQTSQTSTYDGFSIAPGATLSSTQATPGSIITVNGTGYGADEQVQLIWNCPSGTWCSSTVTLGTATAGSNGNFSQQVRIPQTATPGERYAIGVAGLSTYDFVAAWVTISGGGTTSPPGVWSWGLNWNGQLGNGNVISSNTPGVPAVVHVDGLSSVTAIAAGYGHVLALRSDGTVWGWGWNGQGAATGSPQSPGSPNLDTPTQVADLTSGPLTNVVEIAAGNNLSVALKSDGTVWTWGDNAWADLGFGANTDPAGLHEVIDPEDPSGLLTGVVAIATSGYTVAALKADGTVRTWGEDCNGSQGAGPNTACHSAPFPILVLDPTDPTGALRHVVSVSSGQNFMLAVTSDGTLWSWGDDSQGGLGRPGTDSCNGVPQSCSFYAQPVRALSHVSAVAAGIAAFALVNSSVQGWGFNNEGEVGNGVTTTTGCKCVPTPSAVSGISGGTLSNVSAISTSLGTGEALLQNGTVADWGQNWAAQLGLVTSAACTCSAVPLRVPGLNGASAIASGGNSNYALAGPTLTTATPAAPGGSVTLTGSGFASNEHVSLYLDAYSSGATPLASATAGAAGALNVTVPLPAGAASAGTHRVVAVGGTGDTSSVLIQLPPHPASAPLQLQRGWNLVTLPLDSAVGTLGALATAITSALGPSGAQILTVYRQGRYETLIPAIGGPTAGLRITGGDGIWILSGGGTVQLSGAANETPDVVALQPGWNLAGAQYVGSLQATSVAAQVDCGLSEIVAYHNQHPVVWTPSSANITLPAGSGFWLLCAHAAGWVPGPDTLFAREFDPPLRLGGFQGTALVSRNGQVVFQQGYGMADVANNIPNSVNTKFRIAQTTYQFTATAVLHLVEQRTLSLTASICTYLSSCPAAWHPITIQELLVGSSGIPELLSGDVPEYNLDTPMTPQQTVQLLAGLPLEFQPGTRLDRGDDSDYEILGYIIEQVTHQSFAQYIQQSVFTPAGMTNSGVVQDGVTVPGLAVGYSNGQPVGPAQGSYDDSNLYASGGIYTTAGDIQKWTDALLGGKLLSPGTVTDMLQAHPPFSQFLGTVEGGDGYGVFDYTAYCSMVPQVDYGSGFLPGVTSDYMLLPGHPLDLILLNNEDSNPAWNVEYAIAGRALRICG